SRDRAPARAPEPPGSRRQPQPAPVRLARLPRPGRRRAQAGKAAPSSLCFAADQVPDVIAVLVAARGLLDLELARPRQLDRHLLADAARARGEHDDAVAEIDRFLDVVRD